jgi:hypothetical protein
MLSHTTVYGVNGRLVGDNVATKLYMVLVVV